uniref:Uncharacterized protein n=1 Tax=Acrobeloides nanus TaxID=290746 RepID=A0A914DSU3_9BILA
MYPSIPRVKMQIGSTKNNLRMGVKTSKNPISIQASFAAVMPSTSSQIIDSTSKELDWNYIFLEHQLISIQASFAALPSTSSQIIDSTSKELDWNYIFLEHQLRNDVSNLVLQDELPCTSNSCVALQKDVRKRERSRNNRYNKKNRTEEGNDEDRSELET